MKAVAIWPDTEYNIQSFHISLKQALLLCFIHSKSCCYAIITKQIFTLNTYFKRKLKADNTTGK